MEVLGAPNHTLLICLYEVFGTALLLISINLSVSQMPEENHGHTDGQAVAASIFVSILVFGHLSGGHFNPAVTLAVWIKESFRSNTSVEHGTRAILALVMILSQLSGALLGFLLSYMILKKDDEPFNIFYLCPPVTKQYNSIWNEAAQELTPDMSQSILC